MFGGFCGPGNGYNYGGYSGTFGLWGWIGFFFNLLFWAGLIVGLLLLAVWAIRRARIAAEAGGPNAEQILQSRYARGEITRAQYEAAKQALAGPAANESLVRL